LESCEGAEKKGKRSTEPVMEAVQSFYREGKGSSKLLEVDKVQWSGRL